jgi:hypothetical protein
MPIVQALYNYTVASLYSVQCFDNAYSLTNLPVPVVMF